MLKVLTRIVRAGAAQSAESLADRHALLVLDGQMRNAAKAAEACRRALAIAAAQEEGEARRLDALSARIRDLEERTIAALRDGAEDLATRGAETIAALDEDRQAAGSDRTRFAAEFARLRQEASAAERRLAALGRGRRTAEATEAVRRLRAEGGTLAAGRNSLRQAEETLARLRTAQARDEAAEHILHGLTQDGSAEVVLTDMARAGYGASALPAPAAVLERLRLLSHRTA